MFITLDLLPLGMESTIIKNDDISGSGVIKVSNHNARLFHPGYGLCVPKATTDLYLQVNFSKLITVNAVAMQGDIATYQFNRLTYGLRFDNGTRGAVSISSLLLYSIFNNHLSHSLLFDQWGIGAAYLKIK